MSHLILGKQRKIFLIIANLGRLLPEIFRPNFEKMQENFEQIVGKFRRNSDLVSRKFRKISEKYFRPRPYFPGRGGRGVKKIT